VEISYLGSNLVWSWQYKKKRIRRIKMPLGMEVDLGTGDIVFVGDPAPSPHGKRHSSPSLFIPCLLLRYDAL